MAFAQTSFEYFKTDYSFELPAGFFSTTVSCPGLKAGDVVLPFIGNPSWVQSPVQTDDELVFAGYGSIAGPQSGTAYFAREVPVSP